MILDYEPTAKIERPRWWLRWWRCLLSPRPLMLDGEPPRVSPRELAEISAHLKQRNTRNPNETNRDVQG